MGILIYRDQQVGYRVNSTEIDIINCLIDGSSHNSALPTHYAYISNPNKTIRWLYPSSLKSPTFLSFYSTSSIKSWLIAFIIKVAFFLKLSKSVRTSELPLSIMKDSILGEIIDKYPGYSHSVFTGTIGINRKILIELNKNKRSEIFIKLPISDESRELVNNEFRVLSLLNRKYPQSFKVPQIIYYGTRGDLALSNVRPKTYKQPKSLGEAHINALDELYSYNNSIMKWKDSRLRKIIKRHINGLSSNQEHEAKLGNTKIPALTNKLKQLLALLNDNELLAFGMTHGDFTPWNMYLSKNSLSIYDWELSNNDSPLLYDLFHFIFQSKTLIEHKDYATIKSEIIGALNNNAIHIMAETYNVNINFNYVIYLLQISSYYISLYAKQKKLHEQAYWLLDTWDAAITDALNNNGEIFQLS